MPRNNQTEVPLSLALQGGGAHGAFTWGVLDALLEDPSLRFEGVSGTSAGAMNAICLAQGLMVGGREGAREALSNFWQAVAKSSSFTNGGSIAMAPAMKMMLRWAEHLSPEILNPLDINPLRDILSQQIDFKRLRQHNPISLFIAATHANSGKLRIFRNPELSVDALLASGCLPTIHRSIIINGEPFWDGGYSANPAVYPLIYECHAADVMLVLLTPLYYVDTPQSADEIRARMGELAFSAPFLREMQMFAHLQEQVRKSWLPNWLPIDRFEQRIRELRFHAINADALFGALPAESKLAVNMGFFERLRDDGRAHAKAWLVKRRSALGNRPTLDISSLYY